jgi:pectate lyase
MRQSIACALAVPVMVIAGLCAALAKEPSTAQTAERDVKILQTIEQAFAALPERPGQRALSRDCTGAATGTRPGLTVTGGTVTAANMIDEIGGFAKTAGVTGGLGGTLMVVTTLADYDPKAAPVPGSLRAAVDTLAKTKSPGWIVFDPTLTSNARISLTAPLRLPSNVTLDGTCADVTLEATSKIGLVYIFETRNIIVTNLAFRKSDYVAGQPDADVEGCIRLNGNFDAVAILHNDLERCADGVIDSTVSPKRPLPDAARVTIAYNFVRDHDKTMLFGTFGCANASETFAQGCAGPKPGDSGPPPALYLTLEGNVFLRTGQRHPRLYGRTYGHMANNVVIFEPQLHGDGQRGSAYGIFVSNGAQAVVERNVFLAMGANSHPAAIWTTTTPGAERMPEDVEGAILARDNLTLDREIIGTNAPSTVAEPIYRNRWTSPQLTGKPLKDGIACIASRAGRGGASVWPAALCGR